MGNFGNKGKEGMAKYNFLNKKEPMDRALRELKATAWLAGLRRSQSEDRKNRPFIEKQGDVLKIYPILDWDDQDRPTNTFPITDCLTIPWKEWAMTLWETIIARAR